jgi:hypothetical protein
LGGVVGFFKEKLKKNKFFRKGGPFCVSGPKTKKKKKKKIFKRIFVRFSWFWGVFFLKNIFG